MVSVGRQVRLNQVRGMMPAGAFRLGALLACLSGTAPACPHQIDQMTLDTGLRIYVAQSHNPTPGLLHMFWLGSGSVDDPPGRSGTAHMLEHLVARRDVEGDLDRFGAYGNAATSYHYTVYWEHFPSKYVQEVMRTRVQSLRPPDFNNAMVERERGVIFSEKYGELERNPLSDIYDDLREQLYGEKSYGTPVIGRQDELLNITPEEVNAYFKKHYSPLNAFVLLVGNIDTDRAFAVAEEAYSSFGLARSHLDVQSPKYQANRYIRIWKTLVEDAPRNHRDIRARELLALVLGGDGKSGRLYNKLVVTDEIATSIGVSYRPNEPGFYIFGRPLAPADNKTLDAAILAEIEAVAKTGPTQNEMDWGRKQLRAEWLFACDALMGAGFTIGEELLLGVPPADIRQRDHAIEALTKEDVQRAARELISTMTSVSASVGPERTEKDQ